MISQCSLSLSPLQWCSLVITFAIHRVSSRLEIGFDTETLLVETIRLMLSAYIWGESLLAGQSAFSTPFNDLSLLQLLKQ